MAEMIGQQLALFDLDGTLTRKDTLWEIIKFFHGKLHFYAGIIRLAPFLFLFKIGFLPNWKTKEKLLTYFFGGMSAKLFQEKCDQFSSEILPLLLRKDGIQALEKFKHEGAHIIIVSASAENWLLPWCEKEKIDCIATKLEVKNDKITGRIAGKNCHGTEKVNRIYQTIDLSKYTAICAYGDSQGDLPMLKLATHANYKAFRR